MLCVRVLDMWTGRLNRWGLVLAVVGGLLACTSASEAITTVPGSYAAAPFYLAVSQGDRGAGVWNAVTGKKTGEVGVPAAAGTGAIFDAVTAAGDDRTFMLAATRGFGAGRSSPIWFTELRLRDNGSIAWMRPLSFPHQLQGVVGHWAQSLASMALSADGTELAIATDRMWGDRTGPADIEVVSLATRVTRTWWSTRQDISSLSWAGDGTLSFLCAGVCLLNTVAPGSILSSARLLIPWPTTYHGMQSLQWPVITPDGSAVYAAMQYVAPKTLAVGMGLVEFSARTGRPVRVVIQPQNIWQSPNIASGFCSVLGSDLSGLHLTAACTWGSLTGTIDNGRFTAGHNPLPGSVATGEGFLILIAW
jgi:hypothetical protein